MKGADTIADVRTKVIEYSGENGPSLPLSKSHENTNGKFELENGESTALDDAQTIAQIGFPDGDTTSALYYISHKVVA